MSVKIWSPTTPIFSSFSFSSFLVFKKPEKEENKPTPTADAIKFKEEYEKLNSTIRESDGAKYNSITIVQLDILRRYCS